MNYLNNVWWPAREFVEEAVKNRFEVILCQSYFEVVLCVSMIFIHVQVDPSGRVILLENGGVPWKEHFFTIEEEKGLVPENITYILFTGLLIFNCNFTKF